MNCKVNYNGAVIGSAKLSLIDPSMGVVHGIFVAADKIAIIETLKKIMAAESLTFQIFDSDVKCIDTGPVKNVNVVFPSGEIAKCVGLHFMGFYDEDINLELYGVSNWDANNAFPFTNVI